MLIQGNEVQSIASSSTDVCGIYLSSGYSNVAVTSNKIHTITYSGASTFKAYGIYASSTFPLATNLACFNNMVYDINAPSATNVSTAYNTAGIYLSSGKNNAVYFNSVYISGDQGNGAGPSFAFFNGDTAFAVVDNIFANVSPNDTAKDYAIGLSTRGYSLSTIQDYNLYYVSGTRGYIGQFR